MRADAADADHLPRDVDDLVALQQPTALRRERGEVAAHHLVRDRLGALRVLDERWVVDDAAAPVDHLGDLGEERVLVWWRALRIERSASATAAGSSCWASVRTDSTSTCSYQTSSGDSFARRAMWSRYDRTVARTASCRTSTSMPIVRHATSMLAARRFTSHSHGPRQRLVEVVDVEHEAALGRGEDAEVQDVRVTARLHLQPAHRRGREVVAMTSAAPRRNVNGETIMRPTRMGTSSGNVARAAPRAA